MEISGLEIAGPSAALTLAQAQADRLVKSKKFVGRGVVRTVPYYTVLYCTVLYGRWPGPATTSTSTTTPCTTAPTAGSG